MTAMVNVAGFRASFPVVKRNRLTTLIVLDDGNIIKRHNRKHDVELRVHSGVTFSPVVRLEKVAWYRRFYNRLKGVKA